MLTHSTLDSQTPSLCSLGRYESNLSIYSQEKNGRRKHPPAVAAGGGQPGVAVYQLLEDGSRG